MALMHCISANVAGIKQKETAKQHTKHPNRSSSTIERFPVASFQSVD